MGIRQELTDYRVAIKRGYQMTDEIKKKMTAAIEKIFDDPKSSKREIVAAAKVVIAAEQHLRKSEGALSDNERILELAERIGIRSEVEAAAQRSADRVPCVTAESEIANGLREPQGSTEPEAEEATQ